MKASQPIVCKFRFSWVSHISLICPWYHHILFLSLLDCEFPPHCLPDKIFCPFTDVFIGVTFSGMSNLTYCFEFEIDFSSVFLSLCWSSLSYLTWTIYFSCVYFSHDPILFLNFLEHTHSFEFSVCNSISNTLVRYNFYRATNFWRSYVALVFHASYIITLGYMH